MENSFLSSAIKQFEYYRFLGEKTFSQVPDEKLNWKYNDESNSISTIVKHLAGNMLSRWTDFLSSDGEQVGRDRDAEFLDESTTRQNMIDLWNNGWDCLLNTLRTLREADLEKIVYIRNQGHSVTEAINRQLSHYPYHIGQIVFLGRMISGKDWVSLSIPLNTSKTYNQEKFSREKQRSHFSDDYLKK